MSLEKKVLVLMGGFSSEKGVSLVSGRTAAGALTKVGYRVEAIDVTREVDRQIRASFGGEGPDVVFNALHGPFGEDGTVQGLLEMMGLPYTHSGVLSSALCMEKARTKDVLAAAGLRVPGGHVIDIAHLTGSAHPMPAPYVLKPISEGSTFGVVIIKHPTDPAPRRELLDESVYHGGAIVEEYIAGRELTVALKGTEALAVTEIQSDFYDYDAKYSSNAAPHVVPAELPDEITREALAMAERAGKVLGCRGLSRVDFRYDPERDGVNGLFILEVNTQPGMTPTSLSAEQAAYRGISFEELCQWMVEDASCRR
ncbi:D-alanine--D-alanine ligase [Parvularcula maris]|uniref:D-alanine--D-alanine ligase n=1 Tax=Parvularcula maris TaxID=2965077 RepID=A0A9X2RJZ3_9PROT|nr:D-alanine--D-alanine ligase [Parvularcula maris]MCQ8185087.1 D-alanine--D-alanine ligase [Parvularcula maris]